jgi:hypothetical protein
MEYFAHWLKGASIGTWSVVGDEPAEMKASVRPISSLQAVDLGAYIYNEGLSASALRFATLRFSFGENIMVDVREHSGADRDQADKFIDRVLDAVANYTASGLSQ